MRDVTIMLILPLTMSNQALSTVSPAHMFHLVWQLTVHDELSFCLS